MVMETIFMEMEIDWDLVREDEAYWHRLSLFLISRVRAVQATTIIPLATASKNSGSVYEVDVGHSCKVQ